MKKCLQIGLWNSEYLAITSRSEKYNNASMSAPAKKANIIIRYNELNNSYEDFFKED